MDTYTITCFITYLITKSFPSPKNITSTKLAQDVKFIELELILLR